MSVFSISVDKGVQSLWDDGAVDGGPQKYSAFSIIKYFTDTFYP